MDDAVICDRDRLLSPAVPSWSNRCAVCCPPPSHAHSSQQSHHRDSVHREAHALEHSQTWHHHPPLHSPPLRQPGVRVTAGAAGWLAGWLGARSDADEGASTRVSRNAASGRASNTALRRALQPRLLCKLPRSSEAAHALPCCCSVCSAPPSVCQSPRRLVRLCCASCTRPSRPTRPARSRCPSCTRSVGTAHGRTPWTERDCATANVSVRAELTFGVR